MIAEKYSWQRYFTVNRDIDLHTQMAEILRIDGFRATVRSFTTKDLNVPKDIHVRVKRKNYPDINIRLRYDTGEIFVACQGKNVYKVDLCEPTSITGLPDTVRMIYDRIDQNTRKSSE